MFSAVDHKWRFVQQVIRPLSQFDIRLTSADSTQLFLCAFVVTAPVATTLKIQHEARKRFVEEKVENFRKEIETIMGEESQSIDLSFAADNCF